MGPSKSAEDRALEVRRERNRNSQRVARQKQAIYIRELEERIENLSRPEDDRIAKLEKENSGLRNQLLDVHKALESVQSTLRTLSTAASSVTNPNGKKRRKSQDQGKATTPDVEEKWPPMAGSECFHHPNLQHWHALEASDATSDPSYMSNSVARPHVPYYSIAAHQCGGGIPMPSIELTSSTGQLVFGINLPAGLATQSFLGNHLATIKHFLQPQFVTITNDYSSVSKLAVFMFSAFAACAWPALRTYFIHTRAHVNLSKILLWRAIPTESTQASLQPRHAPTMLQLVEGYPLAIDIIPFPSVRDRLITHYATDPNLDRVICEVADAFVVQTNLAQMVMGFPSGPCFVGVWDLARAMDADVGSESGLQDYHAWACSVATETNEAQLIDAATEWFPATNVAEIFEDRSKARAAFNFLRMNQGAVHWRLDPELFHKYPLLLDVTNDSRAKGVRLKPPRQLCIPTPQKMDLGTVSMYREFAKLSIDM